MGKGITTTDKPAKAEAKSDAPKRKILTPEERVKKAEAELAELRKKAEARANKARNQAIEKRAKLVEKRDALNVQILELTEVIGDEQPDQDVA